MRTVVPLFLALALIPGCPGDTDTDTDTEPGATLEALEVTPSTPVIAVGEAEQLTATARFDDGSTQDVTAGTEWRVVNASVAEVDAAGRLIGLSEGTTDVEATYQGVTDSIRVQVTTSSIGGEVRFLGHPVAGVTVILGGDGDDETTTDINGRYAFPGLPNGTFTVETVFEDAPRAEDDFDTAQVNASVITDLHLDVLSAGYPIAPDTWEPDNVPGSAKDLSLGVFQHHTLYNDDEPADGGDTDFMRVSLQAGTTYEFVTGGLCATCDTIMALLDSTAATVLEDNDDVVYLNSGFTFTPEADGDYLLRVEAYDRQYGVASYFVGFVEAVDADDDGYGIFDCDDNDDERYPRNAETPSDGVDQDCSGGDLLPDPDEPNDDRVNAIPAVISEGPPLEYTLDLDALEANTRTLGTDDVDLWSVTVPPRSAIEVSRSRYGADLTFLDPDGVTTRADLANTTDAPVTYYVRVEGTEGPYTLSFYSLGTDQDRDGFYSRDWDEDRDCDDNNGAVVPDEGDPCDGSL